MPIKKVIRDLKKSLKRERDRKRTTLICKWWGKWKIRSIENRIQELELELKQRKIKGEWK